MLRSYCQTISALSCRNFQCSLVESKEGQFLAVRKITSSELILVQADPLALEFFEDRLKFLDSLDRKYSNGSSSDKLLELSSEIIYLYRQYHHIKQKVGKKIKFIKQVSEKTHMLESSTK